MMRNKSLWAVLSCVAVLGLTAGCSDDDAVCGDGVIGGGEDCDLDQLGGATCSDVGDFTGGTLACSLQCVYDITGCSNGAECGNGINEFGEVCDCGSDIMNLPAGCTDINGGANANCSDTCARVDVCGDGIVSGMEECDCGNAAWITDVPTDCTSFNAAAGPCFEDCTEDPNANCSGGVDDVCTGEALDFCCEDDWAVQLDCKADATGGADSYCARSCADTTECYRNTWCLSLLGAYDDCWTAYCWPEQDADIVAEINGPCQVPGGGTGICTPALFGRSAFDDSEAGICIEPGGLGQGAVCPFAEGPGLFSTDRTADHCDGLCYGQTGSPTGNCRSLCNWEEAYAEVVYGAAAQWHPCPADSACMSESAIESSSSATDYGLRGTDGGICMDVAASGGKDSCSLITGQLMDGSGDTCASMGTWTEGRCEMYWDAYDGSLIGECQDGTVPSVATIWGACTPGTDVCPAGSDCVQPDVFDAATPTMAAVCVPRCDTEHADGVRQHCDDLGAAITGDGTPTCQSRSWLFGTEGAADLYKSRLGYCGY